MALKTGKLFKDFEISISTSSNTLSFIPRYVKNFKTKSDNFSTEIVIQDNSTTNIINTLLDYRYLTFDNYNIFEIKNQITNGKYVTLYVDYLFTLPWGLNYYDNTFLISGVSAQTLQGLGLDIQTFISIININADFTYSPTRRSTGVESFTAVPAIKIRFSEYPQWLSGYCSLNASSQVSTPHNAEFIERAREWVNYKSNPQSILNQSQSRNANSYHSFETGWEIYFIIPPGIKSGNKVILSMRHEGDAMGRTWDYNMFDLFDMLRRIISNATDSIQLTFLTNNSLYGVVDFLNQGIMTEFTFSNENYGDSTTNTVASITVPAITSDFHECIVCEPDGVNETRNNCFGFLLKCGRYENEKDGDHRGIVENLGFYKVYYPTDKSQAVWESIRIFNNKIDISKKLGKKNKTYILVKRKYDGLRVYINEETDDYVDISTSINFSRDAFSNYYSYEKSNIDLVQQQQLATYELSVRQNNQSFLRTSLQKGVNAISSWIGGQLSGAASVLSGNVMGGVSQLVGSQMGLYQNAANIGFDAWGNAQTVQNAAANLELQQQQAIDTAQNYIVPQQTLHGISYLSDILMTFDGYLYNGSFISFLGHACSYGERETIKNIFINNKKTAPIDPLKTFVAGEINFPTWSPNLMAVKITKGVSYPGLRDATIIVSKITEL